MKPTIQDKIVTAWCLKNNVVPSPDSDYKNGKHVNITFDAPKWLSEKGFTGIPSQAYDGPQLRKELESGKHWISGGELSDQVRLDYLRYYLGLPTVAPFYSPFWGRVAFEALTAEDFPDYDEAVAVVSNAAPLQS